MTPTGEAEHRFAEFVRQAVRMTTLSRRNVLRLGVAVVGTTVVVATDPPPAIADTPTGEGPADPRAGVWDSATYGVVADGRTDCATAINELIYAVGQRGGGTVLLPSGTMNVGRPIEMASGVSLRGHGWTSVLRLVAEINGGGVIQFGGVTDIVIEDLKVEGGRTASTPVSTGILGKTPGGYRNVTIRNVWVDSTDYSGIALLGSEDRSVLSGDITVVGCRITDAGGQGIVAQWGVDQCRIERCTVVGYSLKHPDCIGIAAGRFAYDIVVTGNRVECTQARGASAHGISLDSVFGRAVCSDNAVVGAIGFGIEVGFVTDGSFTRNTVTGGTRAGIMMTSIGAADDRPYASNLNVVVGQNLVDGTGADGIAFYMGETTPEQSCPAAGRIRRNAQYRAAPVERVVDGRRMYECLESGTTGPVKPPQWGSTAAGESIEDGTTVWVDRGLTNAAVEISDNVVRNVGGLGIHVCRALDTRVVRNTILRSGLSGIHVAATANMFALLDNEIEGCNSTKTAGDAAISVIAYTDSAHVAEIAGNRLRGNEGPDFVATDSVSGARIDDRFAVNCTDPTVAFGREFRTQNTAQTALRMFRDPNSDLDREIAVVVGDPNTTFVNSVDGRFTLRMTGGVDYHASPGAILKFRWDSDKEQWTEVFRTNQSATTPTLPS